MCDWGGGPYGMGGYMPPSGVESRRAEKKVEDAPIEEKQRVQNFCSECGTKLVKEANFCHLCGDEVNNG